MTKANILLNGRSTKNLRFVCYVNKIEKPLENVISFIFIKAVILCDGIM